MKKRNKTELIQVRLDPEMREKLEKKLLKEGRTISEVVRNFIRKYVKHDKD